MIKLKKYFGVVKNYLFRHKIIFLILILVIVFVGYKIYGYYTNTSNEPRYVVSAVTKGTIISTVSGTGQVSAYQQIELKPKASGDIVYLGAKTGDYVSAGQLLLQVDSRDAELSLENAKLSLVKITESNNGKIQGLTKNYEDSLINVNNTFLDFPPILEGLDQILNNYSVSVYKMNLPDKVSSDYYDRASASYWKAEKSYNQALSNFQKLSRPASNNDIIKIAEESYQMSLIVSQAAKDTYAFVNYVYNNRVNLSSNSAEIISDRNNLNTWIGTINSNVTSLGTGRNTLKNVPLDIKGQELAVKQQENSYSNYFLYAPFSGAVQIDVTPNGSVSSGGSIGTLVSSKKIATVSLNEVDVAKVKVGQKATLTFDAIDGLSIAGEVSEVDIVGTVSQGVVSYNAKISFNTQDSRIRSGMSVSADIAVDVRQDILVVPSSAVKSIGNNQYVETFGEAIGVTGRRGITSTQIPSKITVTTGQSDDTNTEILSGLKEGDKIITQTLSASAVAKSAASITSLFSPKRTTASGTTRISSGTGASRSAPDFHP